MNNIMRAVIQIIGLLAVLLGLLWIGQGLGLIMWPKSSFMLAERQWAVNGTILAAVGAVLLWLSRRR
ncbi:MAG: hypothetical protein ABI673_10585 [Novosphingobium sp.]